MPFENQQQVQSEIDLRSQRLDVCDERLGESAADNVTIRELLGQLNDGGTADIQRTVQDSVDQAQDTIRSQFEADHTETKREQADAEQIEQELQGVASTDTDNAEHLAAARADLHGEEAGQPLDAVEQKLRDESEALRGEAERLRERNDKSRSEAERLLRQVIHEHSY